MEMPTNGSRPADPEVAEPAARRWFTPQYKLKTQREAERCSAPRIQGLRQGPSDSARIRSVGK